MTPGCLLQNGSEIVGFGLIMEISIALHSFQKAKHVGCALQVLAIEAPVSEMVYCRLELRNKNLLP